MTNARPTPVVVGVDGSPESAAAARWAADEAGRRQVPLRLMNAYTVPVLGFPGYPAPADLRATLRRAGNAILDSIAADLRSTHPGLVISTMLEHADPRHALLTSAENVALLVIGSHGDGRLPGLTLGSVATSVAAHSPIPVVVVPLPESKTSGLGPILLGVDASGSAGAAIATAFEEAE